jgi:hypothetical protein
MRSSTCRRAKAETIGARVGLKPLARIERETMERSGWRSSRRTGWGDRVSRATGGVGYRILSADRTGFGLRHTALPR